MAGCRILREVPRATGPHQIRFRARNSRSRDAEGALEHGRQSDAHQLRVWNTREPKNSST